MTPHAFRTTAANVFGIVVLGLTALTAAAACLAVFIAGLVMVGG